MSKANLQNRGSSMAKPSGKSSPSSRTLRVHYGACFPLRFPPSLKSFGRVGPPSLKLRRVNKARRAEGVGEIPPADLPAEVSTQAGHSQFRSDIFKQTPPRHFLSACSRMLARVARPEWLISIVVFFAVSDMCFRATAIQGKKFWIVGYLWSQVF